MELWICAGVAWIFAMFMSVHVLRSDRQGAKTSGHIRIARFVLYAIAGAFTVLSLAKWGRLTFSISGRRNC